MAKTKRYFGLSWLVCVILAIIPVTSIICGIVTRVQRGHVIAAIFNFILCPFFYIADLITMIFAKDITIFA